MFDLTAYLLALAAILTANFAAWLVSLHKRDVSIVDSLWSLMFLTATLTYAAAAEQTGPRTPIIVALVAIWAIRLSLHITWRNLGEGEDYRYREIRRNNEPRFELKSLYLVFGLQGILAWIISLPLLAATTGLATMGILDYAGILVVLVGIMIETVGDIQLARFKAKPENKGRVLNTGCWRYSRHPNYFGEFCIWWGFYFIALSAGGWWSIFSPILMAALLLKVSGVALLEKDIGERRPAYADYIRRTNAFIPGPPKNTDPEPRGEIVD